jgi:hypothetical protein
MRPLSSEGSINIFSLLALWQETDRQKRVAGHEIMERYHFVFGLAGWLKRKAKRRKRSDVSYLLCFGVSIH